MKFEPTKIPGVYIVNPRLFQDNRGIFIKTFHKSLFKENSLETDLNESCYSISAKGVIRGMHFQVLPNDNAKIVYVTNGLVESVVLDIRRGSPAYGEYVSVEISDTNNRIIYVPKGCAHGFYAKKDNSCVVYLQTSMYNETCDKGILYSSFNKDWGIKNPTLSNRDLGFVPFKEYDSPFVYGVNS